LADPAGGVTDRDMENHFAVGTVVVAGYMLGQQMDLLIARLLGRRSGGAGGRIGQRQDIEVLKNALTNGAAEFRPGYSP